MGNKNNRAVKLTRRFKFSVVLFLILILALSLSSFAAILYLMASQELGKSFFSAHRDLQQIWDNLLPAVVVSGAAIGVISIIIFFFGLLTFNRAIENTGGHLMSALERIGRGDFKMALEKEAHDHLKPLVDVSDQSIESLKKQVQEVKNISQELYRGIMRLNYLAFEREDVTIAELKKIAANLNTLSREINNSLKWFEL